MVVNLIDAGYFVSRAAKHWAPCSAKGPRNLRWWHQRHKLGKCSFKEMRYKQIGIMKKDIDLLYVRMRQMSSSPEHGHRVIVCYDGIHGRQARGLCSLPTRLIEVRTPKTLVNTKERT